MMALCGGVLWRADMLRRHNVELQSALDLANHHESATRRLLYDSQIKVARQALDSGQAEFAQEVLEGLKPGAGQVDLRGFEWHYLNRVSRRDASLLFDNHIPISTMVLGLDDRTLVAGDGEGDLIFWDMTAGRERARVRAHSGAVGGLLFSPDGRVLTSWTSTDVAPGEVKLWDPATGRPLASIPTAARGRVGRVRSSTYGRMLAIREDHDNRPRYALWDLSRGPEQPAPARVPIDCDALAFSPDGHKLATAGPDRPGSVMIRDPSRRRTIRTIETASRAVLDMAFIQDGKRLATVLQGRLAIWEADSGREIASFSRFPATTFQLSPDGDRLAAISFDRTSFCLIVDLSTRPRECIPGTRATGNLRTAFSPDGRALALGGLALAPAIWDTSSGRKGAVFPGKPGDVEEMVFTRDGRLLIFASDYGKVHRWHVEGQRESISELAKAEKEVWAIAYAPDGKALASAGDDHLIKLWNPTDGSLASTLRGHGALVSSVAFSPDGTRLASASFDKTVRIWDLKDDQPLKVLKGHTDRVRAVAFSPDGRKLASASSDKTVRLWDAETGRPLFTFRGHHDSAHAVAFDRDGKILVSASNDRTIKGIDPETGAERFSLASLKPNLTLTFSRDGRTLATADDTGSITLWDMTTWARRASIKGSDAAVWGVSYSPDGRTLATACDDAKVRLWDPANGQMTLELVGHADRVNAVSFSPDGRTLATCDHAGAIRLWQAGEPGPTASE